MPAASPRYALSIALLLAAGCSGTPSQAPSVAPSPSPSTATLPEPATSQAPSMAPAASPSTVAAPTATQDGRVTLIDMPAGQRVEATTPGGRALLLGVSSAGDRAIDVPVSVSPGAQGAASAYRAASNTPAAMPFPATTGDLAARALAAPSAPSRRLQQAATRDVGSSDTFWINTGGFTPETDRQQSATLRRVSAHAYFYVDAAAASINEAALDAFVSTFEQTIYPRVTAAFGEEAKPGVDGDAHLFVVVSPAVHDFERNTDLLGYFWAPDASPSAGGHSNHKEALFVSDAVFKGSSTLVNATLAHEFEHLINFSRKGPLLNYAANEATWLDEGMAMLSMEVAGFGLSTGERLVATNVRDFEANPGAYTLQDWAANPDGQAFGQSYLFVRYLVDRHGEGVLKELIASPKRGQEALDEILARHGDSFAHLFRAWTIANVFSDAPASAGTPYRYKNLTLTGTYGGVTLGGIQPERPSGSSFTASVKPWSTRYYRFEGPTGTAWRLGLTAPAGGPVAAGAVSIP